MDTAQADTVLEEAMRAMQLPTSNGRIYIGCDAAAMRRICTHLLWHLFAEQLQRAMPVHCRLFAVQS